MSTRERPAPAGRPSPFVSSSEANRLLDDTRRRAEAAASTLAAGLLDLPGEPPTVALDRPTLAALLGLVDRIAVDLDRLAAELTADRPAEVARSALAERRNRQAGQ